MTPVNPPEAGGSEYHSMPRRATENLNYEILSFNSYESRKYN